MQYHFRDRNPFMVDAWKVFFKNEPDVIISQGDIFAEEAGEPQAVVSPANSYGFMDGGIDFVYSEYFGWNLQERLQGLLRKQHHGMLPIGDAVILRTHHKRIPYLVSAPTMTVPMVVNGSINAYLAMRAVIRAVKEHNWKCANNGTYQCETSEGVPVGEREHEDQIVTVLCPGLGTAVGKMDFKAAAFQMYEAYKHCDRGQITHFNNLADAWGYHENLRRGVC